MNLLNLRELLNMLINYWQVVVYLADANNNDGHRKKI